MATRDAYNLRAVWPDNRAQKRWLGGTYPGQAIAVRRAAEERKSNLT